MTSSILVRNMRGEDLDDLMRIQRSAYPPEFNESLDVFSERLQVCSATAWVAEMSEKVCAYLMGHRSRLGSITALSDVFTPNPQGDTLYLHDLALDPIARGQKIANQLLQRAEKLSLAQGCHYMALVSVQNTSGFWEKQGFASVGDLSPEQSRVLATYSGDAIYMVRPLT